MAGVVLEHPQVRGVKGWLPEGRGLQDEAFARRHALVRTLLLAHLPALAVLGYANGFPLVDLLAGLGPMAVAWVVAGTGHQQLRATSASAGLAIASLLVVLWSHGSIEAHFHVFVVIGFVSIYQNRLAFASVVVLTLGSEAVFTAKDPGLVFDHHAAQSSPWVWTAIHAGFVLAECVAMMIFWRSTEEESRRATRMATEMTIAELQRSREQADQRQASSDLLTNLARRNQSLLSRQLTRIDQLEKDEDDPEVLAQLFTLDHLATRMRRNAESLLVLSGEEPSRRFGAPVALSEVTRGAIAEVEDYTRADVALASDVLVDGHAVGDLVHLIAELIENAATFSPPSSRVVVSGVPQHDASYVLTVDDGGIGMSDADLAAANATLREAVTTHVELSGQLGFHVIARLAARHGVAVSIARAAGIAATGLRATIHLPAAIVSGQPLAAAEGMLMDAAPAVAAPVALVVPDQATQPVQEQILPAAVAGETVTTSGLARRVPKAALNPNLAAPADAPVAAPEAPASDPDRARSSLDAFYGGLRRGIEAEGEDL